MRVNLGGEGRRKGRGFVPDHGGNSTEAFPQRS